MAKANPRGLDPVTYPTARTDPFSPPESLRVLREETPVRRMIYPDGHLGWLVTGYAAARAILADPRFSTRPELLHPPLPQLVAVRESLLMPPAFFLRMDPPGHTRYRSLLTGQFTVRRMKALEPRIEKITADRLDEMEREGPPVDLVRSFALPIPSLVICELLGVPYQDREDFQRRSSRQLNFRVPTTERFAEQRASREYMMTLVRRARRKPGEDMLGMLVREHGTEVSDDELVGIGGLLLLAGHETTSNMLSLGTIALLQHPDQLAAVRDDPDAVGPAIEELLRYLSVVQNAIPRITTSEVEVGGVVIPAGHLVILSLPAGNHDPHFIHAPDAFDISRGAPGHLAFGHGVHHCLGAPLARMEMRIAFPALLRRFPHLALDEELTEVPFRELNLIYGAESLKVRW